MDKEKRIEELEGKVSRIVNILEEHSEIMKDQLEILKKISQ